jgi:tetratricopeptide (TPR) repeat protein
VSLANKRINRREMYPEIRHTLLEMMLVVAMATLAYVLVSDGQWQEGLDYADRAAKIADSAPVQLHRAMALKGLRRDAEARDALRRASEMNPDPPTKKSIDELKAALN